MSKIKIEGKIVKKVVGEDLSDRYVSYIKFCRNVMLKHTGLRFGSIGLICIAFLFLPVARGLILLRLINIPFEHATRYHIWLGHLTMTLFTLHGGCYVYSWYLENRVLTQVSFLYISFI